MAKNLTSNWMALNSQRFDKLIRDCEVYDLKGSYGGELDLREVIRIVKGAREEINILSRKVEKLGVELEEEKNKK